MQNSVDPFVAESFGQDCVVDNHLLEQIRGLISGKSERNYSTYCSDSSLETPDTTLHREFTDNGLYLRILEFDDLFSEAICLYLLGDEIFLSDVELLIKTVSWDIDNFHTIKKCRVNRVE